MTTQRSCMVLLAAAVMTVLVSRAQAATRTWSGGALGAWTIAGNWTPSGTPTTSDDVVVGAGSTVTNASSSSKTLDIQTNATVKLSGAAGQGGLGSGKTAMVSGTLNMDSGGVLRVNSATVNLAGHFGSSLTWLDLNGGTLNFTDGAVFDNTGMNFEHKGNNTFGFKLSAGGFKTIVSGRLWSGNSAAWSNATYNVDISDYDLRSGLRVVLIDFNGNDAVFNSGFSTAKVNILAGSSGLNANLSFETATSQLVLTFPYPVTWSGGGDGANWLDRLNWIPTNLPTASDTVLVKSGASVTNGQNTFASLEIQTNATVKLSAATGQNGIGARTLKVAGTLDAHPGQSGVVRLGGTTLNLSGHLGSGILFLDTLNGTINYTDGAVFDNPNMSFEHKGWNTFRYTLAPTGFTAIACGYLYSGTSGFKAAWSNATYNIDVSAYTSSRPADIVLTDYSGHENIFTNAFNPTVTVTGLDGGKLRFDTGTSKLILRVSGLKGTLIGVR